MNRRITLPTGIAILGLAVLLLPGCGGGGGGGCGSTALGTLVGSCDKSGPTNQVPVANAGSDRDVAVGSAVTLDGSASRDPDGQSITYAWTVLGQPAGSQITLTGASTARPSFTPSVVGVYRFSLTVSDGSAASAPATVMITTSVPNQPPVANAGTNRSVITGTSVTLDGSASDDFNRDLLTYEWSVVSQPQGSAVTLMGPTTVRPNFTAAMDGVYVFSLRVSDGQTFSAPAYVTVSAGAANVAPVAVAGLDQFVAVGDTVSLDGTGSSDANRDLLFYRWAFVSRPAGSTAALSPAGSARPRFIADTTGAYVLSLVVSDGSLDSAPQYVTITASAANVAPVASAGPGQQVVPGTTVTLDATASSDANRDVLTYSWTMVSRPAGSAAVLSARNVARPTFVADVAGIYIASVQVSDGRLSSAAAVTAVTAASTNAPPIARLGTPQNVRVRSTVLLDGSASTDPNNDRLSYRWSLASIPPGSAAKITGDTAPIASMVPDVGGVFVVALQVYDGVAFSPPAYLTVTATAENVPPTPRVGPDRSVMTNSTVILDGSASSDPDGQALSYRWDLVSKPMTSNAALASAETVRPVLVPDLAGTYVVSLSVSDDGGKVWSPPVIMVVTAGAGAMPPVADAGPAQTVKVGSAVQLDGTRSYDPNGDPLTYHWQISYLPPGSAATLDGNVTGSRSTSSSPRPAFVADRPGVYVITLVVRDPGNAESRLAVVTVTATQ